MDFITNSISLLTNVLTRFFTMCKTFFQSLIDFFNNIGSILSTLWFGLKSLLSGLWSFIEEVFNGQLFSYLYSGFNDLVGWIGYAGIFIAGFLFLVFIRIAIAFVFKLFRLNIDYNTVTKIYDQKDRVVK